MKTIIIDKNKMTYKNFYETLYKEVEADKDDEYSSYVNFSYNTDNVYEFLCFYISDRTYKIVMKNFDLDKMKDSKLYEDYEWNIIIKVLKRFIEKRPINKLEFVND